MKLMMTLLVRDEEDIIEENLVFHLNQGVDFFIVTDNRSIDSTKDILKRYEAKGVLKYLYQDEDTHDQGNWVTTMSRLSYSEYNADWVINNDADEFWWPRHHNSLKEAFLSVKDEYNIIECERNNFVYLVESYGRNPFYEKMYFREKESLNSLGDKLPSKQAHRGLEDIVVSDGNHKVFGFDNVKIMHDLIEIFHFPVRTEKQFLKKISVGGAALENNQKLNKNIGKTWRKLFLDLQKNGNLKDYFNDCSYDKCKIMKALDSGDLIEDKRLLNYLKELR